MSFTKEGQYVSSYERSPLILERRRTLFPPDTIDSEEDSDLGPISPLSFDSDHEELKSLVPKHDNISLLSKTDSVGDYDILEAVDIESPVSTPVNNAKCSNTATMSSPNISPFCGRLNFATENIINETPLKISPLYSLKTPHDASNINSKLPKLIRKSLLDTLESVSNKRKKSPNSSPGKNQNKYLKLDKNSKVRTTLFPEIEFSVPTKSFYSNTENIMEKLLKKRDALPKPTTISVNTSHKIRRRKKMGQINAGVGHKIKKPKKKNSKLFPDNIVSSEASNSAINEFIDALNELKEMEANGSRTMITNKENTDPNVTVKSQIMPPKLIENNVNSKAAINVENKKRPLSPSPEEPNPNKKFFKFSRPKGTFTVNNVKVQMDSGKMTFIEKTSKKSNKNHCVPFDLGEDDQVLPKPNLDNILSILDEDSSEVNMEANNKIVLQAHSSVTASENSIQLHSQPLECTANLILSPISQMCDVTSGLALNSPKKGKNLTSILNGMPNATSSGNNIFNKKSKVESSGPKLFPVFCARNSGISEKKEKVTLLRTAKKFKNIEEGQMLLDAGQKKFGIVQCHECNFVYHVGDPIDENLHTNYHQAGNVLRFGGWKNERVVADFQSNGRIIMINPGDSKIWWKKIKELMLLINRELGCYEMEFNLDNCQVYLYIKSRTIAGCIVAIPKTEGHRMLTTKQSEADLCSEEKYPIKCGIPRVWVSHNYRRQGIGSALMNAVKGHFMLGYVLKNSDIALSAPTEMGKTFAKSYFKSSNYLIYYQ